MRLLPFILLVPASLLGAGEIPKTDAEILEQTATITGFSADVLKLAQGQDSSVMGYLGDQLAAIRIAEAVSTARDDEAVQMLLDLAVGKIKDKVVTGPAATTLTALSAYKTALELYRDYAYLPAIKEETYQKYRELRLTGHASPDGAFDEALGKVQHYAEVKETMVKEYYKARGWKSDQAGDAMEAKIRGSLVDQYWIGRLEAKLQKELISARKEEIRRQMIGAMIEKVNASRFKPVAEKPMFALEKNAENIALIQKFKAMIEAEVAHRNQAEAPLQYRINWNSGPKIDGDKFSFAYEMERMDPKSESDYWRGSWSGVFANGTAESPRVVSVGEIRAQVEKK